MLHVTIDTSIGIDAKLGVAKESIGITISSLARLSFLKKACHAMRGHRNASVVILFYYNTSVVSFRSHNEMNPM